MKRHAKVVPFGGSIGVQESHPFDVRSTDFSVIRKSEAGDAGSG